MGRLIACMTNRADRLHDAFVHERESGATSPRDDVDGVGIGFFQGGEVLQKKRPVTRGTSVDLVELTDGVTSSCVVAHMRRATVGDFRAENTHPFRMRQWLFAHTGTVDRFDAMRRRLQDSLPDFLARNLAGDTDSERVFHTLLSFLHDSGELDNPDVDDRAVISALRSTVALFDGLASEVGARPAQLNMVLTNGRKIYAYRRGLELVYVERRGLHADESSMDLRKAERHTAAANVRYVFVASDVQQIPESYLPVPEAGTLVIDRDLNTRIVT